MMTKVVAVLYICILIQNVCGDWDYSQGTTDWVTDFPECGFRAQSPINIITNQDTQNCGDPLLLKWTSDSGHFVVGNNGHSLQAVPFIVQESYGSHLSGISVLNHNNDTHVRLTNPFYSTFASRVNEEFCLDSIHFHWADNNSEGSEHAINGVHFPLEAHLVHFSCDFYTNAEAQKAYSAGKLLHDYDDDNILAVVSILFEVAPEGQGNAALEAILDDTVMNEIYQYDDAYSFEDPNAHLLKLIYTSFDLNDLVPANREVIAYTGSLTTPPCYQTVRWNIMKHTQYVSLHQLEQFRGMYKENPNDTIAPNWRPLQEMNGRTVFECQQQLDEVSVEKDPRIYEETSDECIAPAEFATWYTIGIIFIVLFGLSLIVIGVMAYKLCENGSNASNRRTNANGQKYIQSKTDTDNENDTVEMGAYQ